MDDLFSNNNLFDSPSVSTQATAQPERTKRDPIKGSITKFVRHNGELYAVMVARVPQELRVSHNAFDRERPGAKVFELFGGGWTPRAELKSEGPLNGLRVAMVAQGMATYDPNLFNLSHNKLGESVATLKPEVVAAIQDVTPE